MTDTTNNYTQMQQTIINYINEALTLAEVEARVMSIVALSETLQSDLEKLIEAETGSVNPPMPEVTHDELRLMELEQEANELRARIENESNSIEEIIA